MKKVAHLLSRAGIEDLFGEAVGNSASEERDKAKKLDVIAVRPLSPRLCHCISLPTSSSTLVIRCPTLRNIKITNQQPTRYMGPSTCMLTITSCARRMK